MWLEVLLVVTVVGTVTMMMLVLLWVVCLLNA